MLGRTTERRIDPFVSEWLGEVEGRASTLGPVPLSMADPYHPPASSGLPLGGVAQDRGPSLDGSSSMSRVYGFDHQPSPLGGDIPRFHIVLPVADRRSDLGSTPAGGEPTRPSRRFSMAKP